MKIDMKINKMYLLALFLLIAVLAIPGKSFAAVAGWCAYGTPAPSTCCNSVYDGGDCLDYGKNWYVGTSCVMNDIVVSAISTAYTAKKVYNCATGETKCAGSFILCGATCKAALADDGKADGVLPDNHGSCTAINRGFDSCTGNCTIGCINGAIEDTSLLWSNTLKCPLPCAYGSLSTSAGCVKMETVASLIAPVFGKNLANLVAMVVPADITTILNNIASNKSYYFLAPTPGPTPPAPGVKYYQYGTDGNPATLYDDDTNKVRLEADWADGAWLAEYLNWNNEPAKTIMTLLGADFCTPATVIADCGVGGVCLPGGICQGSVTGASGVGSFVGLTTDITGSYYSGFAVNSYVKMDEICSNTYAGSHVCTADEMFNSYQKGAVSISSGMGIINNGPPGYTVFANDCNGWKVRAEEYNMTKAFGAVWYFADKKASLVRCDWLADAAKSDYKISCCK